MRQSSLLTKDSHSFGGDVFDGTHGDWPSSQPIPLPGNNRRHFRRCRSYCFRGERQAKDTASDPAQWRRGRILGP